MPASTETRAEDEIDLLALHDQVEPGTPFIAVAPVVTRAFHARSLAGNERAVILTGPPVRFVGTDPEPPTLHEATAAVTRVLRHRLTGFGLSELAARDLAAEALAQAGVSRLLEDLAGWDGTEEMPWPTGN